MVGRTPEYLGKKIQSKEVKLAALGVLVMPIVVLVPDGASRCRSTPGRAGRSTTARTASRRSSTPSPRMTNNNGSAFAGLTGNTAFYNVAGGIAMLLGRFAIMIPCLALAGVAGRQAGRPRLGGDLQDRHADVLGLASRRDPHRRRADLLPGRLARTNRRAAPQSGSSSDDPRHDHRPDRPADRARHRRATRAFRPRDPRPGVDRRRSETRPAGGDPQSRHVRRRSSGRSSRCIESIAHPGDLHVVGDDLAVPDGPVRQLRRGRRRGPRQGAGGHAAQDARRHRGKAAQRRRRGDPGRARGDLARGDVVVVRGRATSSPATAR